MTKSLTRRVGIGVGIAIAVYSLRISIHELSHIIVLFLVGGTISEMYFDFNTGFSARISAPVEFVTVVGIAGGIGAGIFLLVLSKKYIECIILAATSFIYAVGEASPMYLFGGEERVLIVLLMTLVIWIGDGLTIFFASINFSKRLVKEKEMELDNLRQNEVCTELAYSEPISFSLLDNPDAGTITMRTLDEKEQSQQD
ncbi:MAG: hypothetical protein ACTSUO_02735 [Candidatus Thorarchaeota archaeon]